MEVTSVTLEDRSVSVQLGCDYPHANLNVGTMDENLRAGDTIRGSVDSDGVARFVVSVRDDQKKLRLILQVYSAAGTSSWVPNGNQFLRHEIDLSKLRRARKKPPAKQDA